MLDHPRSGHPRLGSTDGPGHDGAGLVEARQDLADAAVGDAQLTTDVARSNAHLSQFNDADAHLTGQWAAVDEQPTQLVDFAKWL